MPATSTESTDDIVKTVAKTIGVTLADNAIDRSHRWESECRWAEKRPVYFGQVCFLQFYRWSLIRSLAAEVIKQKENRLQVHRGDDEGQAWSDKLNATKIFADSQWSSPPARARMHGSKVGALPPR